MRQMRLPKLLPFLRLSFLLLPCFLLLCLVLGACSSFLDDLPEKADPAPYISTSLDDLRKAAEQEKLAKPLEAAGPIAANTISVAPWIICLRSVANEETRQRVYSVFFRDGKLSSVRPSVIVDHCETQNFVPLPDAPSPNATKAAANGLKPVQSDSSQSR
jgi:hypothetical protein